MGNRNLDPVSSYGFWSCQIPILGNVSLNGYWKREMSRLVWSYPRLKWEYLTDAVWRFNSFEN